MSAARPDGGNAKRKWARALAFGNEGGRGVGGKAGWARTLGGWGAGVDSGLELGRSNNAVKAFLNIVNIPKPAADEAISRLAAAPPTPPGSPRVSQVYAAVTKLGTLQV